MKHIQSRGDHTTLIDLANDIVKKVLKKFPDASVSPGVITQGIGAKSQKISITPAQGCVIMLCIMKYSKQEIKIFTVDPHHLFRFLKIEYKGAALVHITK